MQAFLFYIDDWISSKHIEMMDAPEERGYLRLLLRAAKEDDCGLPDDDMQLSIMSMLGTQWAKPTADKMRRIAGKTSGQKLRACFEARDGRLYNARLLREFENQKRVQAARLAAGLKGGRPRGSVNQKETNWLANGSPADNQTECKTQPNGKQNETSPSPSPPTANAVGEKASPKRTGSAEAMGTRFDLDELPGSWREFTANELHWDDSRAAGVFATFADYWRGKPGKDGRKSDWLATWRNWCRREARSPVLNVRAVSPQSATSFVDRNQTRRDEGLAMAEMLRGNRQ